MIRYKISFVGAGKVAGALCRALHACGFIIDQVNSATELSGRVLADVCSAVWNPVPLFTDSSDIIIVSVPDHKLENVLKDLKCSPETLVAHTAGSYGIDIFPEHIKKRAVLYPLQTFSKERAVSFQNLPFLLESSDDHSSAIIEDIVVSLGGNIHYVNTDERKLLHLAAVFVCNFTNYMFVAGKEIISGTGLSLDIVKPLVEETVLKALEIGPENSQTGPAIRNDRNTIERHLELLSFSPELKKIYSEVTKAIMDHFKSRE